ncbi:unannotated protein [freshwater metagenome]|uniref:Unannotated protein n=1 Tax=freshwater metagenome TaxID=449393 RepID=A0A6J7H7V8_9ZZZZ|nr:mechanosensitive ion channel [Actinomycetota bacterium]
MIEILAHPATSLASVSGAAATMLIALVAAVLVARVLRITERRLSESRRGLDAAGHTRLRFLQRLFIAVIVLTGVFIALLQFESFDRIASAAIASGAVLSAIVGFSARDSLANAVSGVSMAVTQPLRVGDVVEIGNIRGTVEDVTLTTTWLRTADQGRVILPNSLITTTPVRNDSIESDRIVPSASVWLAPGADVTAALAALTASPDVREVTVAEVTFEGIRLVATGALAAANARPQAESALRASVLARLRETGVRGDIPG